jgi:hypothetical protein
MGADARVLIRREIGSLKEPSLLSDAIDGAIETLNRDDLLTPGGRIMATVQWVETLGIHPAHHEKVAQLIHEFQQVAVELLANMDYSGLVSERAKFISAVRFGVSPSAQPFRASAINGSRAS